MDLHVTLAAGPGVRLTGGETTEELVVAQAHLATGEQLHEKLAERAGVRYLSVSGTPLRELTPGVPPLTSGAVIVASTAAHTTQRPSEPANLFYLVRSGPDAGKAIPLSRGTYTIGRSSADITIHDPELSRLHAILTVGNDSLTLRDRGSVNGIRVNGSKVEQASVSTESDIVMGSSRCALVLIDAPAEATPAVDIGEPCDISSPLPPEGYRLLFLTALLPLVLGIALAVATGMWFFLAFSALSAVTGLVPLVNGRRKTRAFEASVQAAVAADSERRRRAAPDAGSLAAAALQPRLYTAALSTRLTSDGLHLRLGTADQPANIRVRPVPEGWQPPIIPRMPVLIPLADPDTQKPIDVSIRGPRQTLIRVARLLLLQLSILREAGDILCFGPVSELPAAARFLPRVTLVSQGQRFNELLATGRYSSLVVFGAEPVAETAGLRVFRLSAATEPEEGRWTIDYFSAEPVLNTTHRSIVFQPDYLRAETFNVLAREIAARVISTAGEAARRKIPEAEILSNLIASDSASIAQRWRMQWDCMHLRTRIGSAGAGPVGFDLVADGPHLLVAGTTGSGKSEFLRTLVLGLALNHAPADLNFLFVDFKGGSGLNPLASLPHATGMLTDLSASAVSRALVSLKAEVKRRESIFAEAGAADFRELRGRSFIRLPRLVTVIDEFRILSEEVPGAVQELMRIATLGRSLGMHLVLATQRPQGAIASDIRANITASVALRMQTAMESQDVLDSPAAGTIPVGLPGRAYLRVGSAPAIEFQTATAASISPETPPTRILAYASALSGNVGGNAFPEAEGPQANKKVTSDTDGPDPLVRSVVNAARELPPPQLRVPVCPPLPAMVARSPALPPDLPQLGVLDIPERQEQRPLVWEPKQHSHLAFVGQAGSGLEPALACVATEHLRALPDRHLYLLDATSVLRSAKDAPQVGAYVTPSDMKRAARVLQRVAELVAHRITAGPAFPEGHPLITVMITGWGRWATAFRAGRFAWVEDALQDIARDGEACGVALVVGGERELIVSRFFSLLPTRVYLPVGASPEALLTWPKLPFIDAIPGRAFIQGRLSAGVDAMAQLLTESETPPLVNPAQRPFQVAPLPRYVSSVSLGAEAPGSRKVRIPIGVGGDDLAPVHLALPERSAALVVGAAGSGKSQALDLISRMAPQSLRCLRPTSDEDAEAYWHRAASEIGGSGDLLLVDDADQLPRSTHQMVAAAVSAGARAVLASLPSPVLGTSPVLATLRGNPLGVVLGPRAPTDGELFGLRPDVDGTPPPGRGILVDSHGSMEIQIALCE